MGVSAAALLDAWEHGRDAWPGERAFGLLELGEACPAREVLARWTVGQRDAALLELRERLFGPTASALADCPQCREPLEMEFSMSELLQQDPPDADASTGPVGRSENRAFALDIDGYRILYRLPTAGDLAELRLARGDAPRWLLERCVLSIQHLGEDRADAPAEIGSSETPALTGPMWDALEDALEQTLAEHDPKAGIELALACPACGQQWKTPFDITEFLWQELDSWALRVLWEAHLLAAVYGWSERDILALSDWRRHHYLNLMGGDR
jgi:hypothetical protein